MEASNQNNKYALIMDPLTAMKAQVLNQGADPLSLIKSQIQATYEE